jgi:hypothetical protein
MLFRESAEVSVRDTFPSSIRTVFPFKALAYPGSIVFQDILKFRP